MGGRSARKFDICFYQYYPGAKQQKRAWLKAFLIFLTAQGRSSKKKRLVKGVFNWGKCPGAEVRICRSSRMGGSSAGKIDICFYQYYPGAKQQKKSMVKGFFDFFNCPGAEVRICRSSRMGCTCAGKSWLRKIRASSQGRSLIRSCSSAENFIQELQAEQPPGGGAGAGKLQPCFS